MKLVPIAPKVLSSRILPSADARLLASFGADTTTPCLGLLTCDQDDSLYVALDEATKAAPVRVCFARSLYAGAAHSPGPFAGECLGVLAGADPDVVAFALRVAVRALDESICFYQPEGVSLGFFPHVIGETGSYLSKELGIEEGQPLAYLVAPPVESIIGFDAALKAADVTLLKHVAPPTETNYSAAYLTGELASLQASARAFVDAILEFSQRPLGLSAR